MTGPGPRDLTALHRRIVAAKGGHFGAVSVQPDESSLGARSYQRMLSRPRVGPLVHRVVVRARRLGKR